jgi:hypothetical protein
MKQYIILANPGHNRIYADTSLKIAEKELMALSDRYGLGITEFTENTTGLLAGVCFKTKNKLTPENCRVLGYSSVFYALFEMVEKNLLKPVTVPDFHTFPESMVQILKYNGKTNEQFTRLLVNLALSACESKRKKTRLADLMCGKGTTLYEGFIRGFDVTGVEVSNQYVQEINRYVLRFLKEGRYKHTSEKSGHYDNKKKKIADGFKITAGTTKENFKIGLVQDFQVYNGDTRDCSRYLKKNSFDILVSDLPYGVQHGSKNTNKSQSRSPLALIADAMPGWYACLKERGSMVLSFNEYTLKYEDLAEVLTQNGFKILSQAQYSGLIHRVDQSINRNIIVAVK